MVMKLRGENAMTFKVMSGASLLVVMMGSSVVAQDKAIKSVEVSPDKVIASVTADWNGDGNLDRAVLIQTSTDRDADLLIYLSQGPDQPMTLNTYRPEFVTSGQMFGQQAELRLNKSGSLQVYSQNTAIGRNAWEMTVTLTYQKSGFVVSGLTFKDYDRIDPKATHNCDVNFLTGKGHTNRKQLKVAVGGIPVNRWNEDTMRKVCKLD